jgi:hypothetical protein
VLLGAVLLGAAYSYLWGFGRSMRTEVALRAELSIGVCGCCGYHHGGYGIGVGTRDLAGPLAEGVR